jgi:uncharacterized damage-inducible protein DinB
MKMFAGYSCWANNRLFDAAGQLDDTDYHRDCAVAFSSMHGTLNHILGGDMIWLSRFQNTKAPPLTLDTNLHDTFAALRNARAAFDQVIISFINGLEPDDLNASITYTPVTDPQLVTQQLAPALAHLFNHQTHHRGQAHAILTRLAGAAPALDLIYYQRETSPDMVR